MKCSVTFFTSGTSRPGTTVSSRRHSAFVVGYASYGFSLSSYLERMSKYPTISSTCFLRVAISVLSGERRSIYSSFSNVSSFTVRLSLIGDIIQDFGELWNSTPFYCFFWIRYYTYPIQKVPFASMFYQLQLLLLEE